MDKSVLSVCSKTTTTKKGCRKVAPLQMTLWSNMVKSEERGACVKLQYSQPSFAGIPSTPLLIQFPAYSSGEAAGDG